LPVWPVTVAAIVTAAVGDVDEDDPVAVVVEASRLLEETVMDNDWLIAL
jgi:hypothetical protein